MDSHGRHTNLVEVTPSPRFHPVRGRVGHLIHYTLPDSVFGDLPLHLHTFTTLRYTRKERRLRGPVPFDFLSERDPVAEGDTRRMRTGSLQALDQFLHLNG